MRWEYTNLYMASKDSTLTGERIQELEDIGFEWQLKKIRVPWETRYKSLVSFKDTYGHCNVPRKYPEDKELARWVALQRTEYKKRQEGKTSPMSDERMMKLNSIQFRWSIRGGE